MSLRYLILILKVEVVSVTSELVPDLVELLQLFITVRNHDSLLLVVLFMHSSQSLLLLSIDLCSFFSPSLLLDLPMSGFGFAEFNGDSLDLFTLSMEDIVLFISLVFECGTSCTEITAQLVSFGYKDGLCFTNLVT